MSSGLIAILIKLTGNYFDVVFASRSSRSISLHVKWIFSYSLKKFNQITQKHVRFAIFFFNSKFKLKALYYRFFVRLEIRKSKMGLEEKHFIGMHSVWFRTVSFINGSCADCTTSFSFRKT